MLHFGAMNRQILVWLGIFSALLIGWKVTCNSYEESSRKHDEEFCAKNLAYYKSFCKTYPTHCEGGPRKLAKCEP